jgi:hypothetical protein
VHTEFTIKSEGYTGILQALETGYFKSVLICSRFLYNTVICDLTTAKEMQAFTIYISLP